ncbi:MAG: hypothetical protein R3F60_13980 [bacterium]
MASWAPSSPRRRHHHSTASPTTAARCRSTRPASTCTSGAGGPRRGQRRCAGLAARILALAGWEPGTPLVDPCCGSGTFLIEAAGRAAGLAPGRLRTFACEAWWRGELMPTEEAVPTIIQGSDRSKAAVTAARRNAERAGVAVDLRVASAADVRPPAPTGLLVANPTLAGAPRTPPRRGTSWARCWPAPSRAGRRPSSHPSGP